MLVCLKFGRKENKLLNCGSSLHKTPRRKLALRKHLILKIIFQINDRARTFKINSITLLWQSRKSQETHPVFHCSNKTPVLWHPPILNTDIHFTFFILFFFNKTTPGKPCLPLGLTMGHYVKSPEHCCTKTF